jgi:tetratricopeptide (TPR) repeat protein
MPSKEDLEARAADCDSIDEFAVIAREADADHARELLEKAARHCDDVAATVDYATCINAICSDPEWARKVLDEAEFECQFTKEFVQLATGYKDLFDDMDKVKELMEQAAEFCMTGEEQSDLGDGYWSLLQDRDAAVQAYEKALVDINDKDALLALAAKATSELSNQELARSVYAKAEERMSTLTDRMRLAQSIIDDLGDKELASAIYDQTADSVSNPGDLGKLAAEIMQRLGDGERATAIYRKALARSNDSKQLLALADTVAGTGADAEFLGEILSRAMELGKDSAELVAVAERAAALGSDQALIRQVLEQAEERVTSLGEMRSVAQAIETHIAGDPAWSARIADKLARREANQATYASFQEREKQATQPLQLVRLAGDVMEELEDPSYAGKLLADAEQTWRKGGCDLPQGRELLLAVVRHIGDSEWIARLLDGTLGDSPDFVHLQSVCRLAVSELSDSEAGKSFAHRQYQQCQARLESQSDDGSPYALLKLSAVVHRDLADRAWARTLIESAAALGGDHLAFARMASAAAAIGDDELAADLCKRAFEKCRTADQVQQLVRSIRSDGVAEDVLRDGYAGTRQNFGEAAQLLAWTEAIVTLFGDNDWARQEYDRLDGEIHSTSEKARLNASRRQRLEARFY